MHRKQQGMAYLGLLLLLVILSSAMTGAAMLYSTLQQRAKEQEMLRVGNAIRLAIGRYYNNTPGVVKQYPKALEDLLRDQRHIQAQRYIREIYRDPFTGNRNWGMLIASDGGIMGVYSLSADKPLKINNFRPREQSFKDKKEYGQWIFAYVPVTQ
jgi:type II secretory pathway pseudopilin PulG